MEGILTEVSGVMVKHPAGLCRTRPAQGRHRPCPLICSQYSLPSFPSFQRGFMYGSSSDSFARPVVLMVGPAFLISFPIAAFHNNTSAPASHSEGQCFPGVTPVEDQNSPLCLHSMSQCHVSEEDGSFLIQLLFLAFNLFFLTPLPPFYLSF